MNKKVYILAEGISDMSHSRRKLDLRGQRFGRLTVLEPAENIGGRTAWLCQCDCGNTAVVKTYNLRQGKTTSCGCMGGPTYIDGTCVPILEAAKRTRVNNTSGVPGVVWCRSKGLWRATICFQGKRHYLGGYADFEEAVKARKRGEREFHDKFLKEHR